MVLECDTWSNAIVEEVVPPGLRVPPPFKFEQIAHGADHRPGPQTVEQSRLSHELLLVRPTVDGSLAATRVIDLAAAATVR
jgi:hypothetical protein